MSRRNHGPVWIAALCLFALVVQRGTAQAQTPRVLYFSHAAGFAHAVRGYAGAVIAQLGQSTGAFTVTATDDVAVLNADTLATFDAIVFYTSGELPITDAQKAAILGFVHGGKGFVGVHSATDTFYTWPEYGDMIGAYFQNHPWDQPVTIRVEDAAHPSTAHLGPSFVISDEIYQFRNWSRQNVHVLLSLDTTGLPPPPEPRSDNDYALAWTKPFGAGRVFYTAFGHYQSAWDDARFRQHVLGGLRWAIGDADGDTLPDVWETRLGLSAASSAGPDGASGDPDGDGLTNAQELAANTHPRGFHAQYLAEGAVNTFFDVRLALLNVGSSPAHVQLRYLQSGGAVLTHAESLDPRRRRTFTRADFAGLSSPDFSTIVEADQPIVLDRTMSWDLSGYGSHAETAVSSPATTWHLAEGATGGDFSLFYLLQNPNTNDATATISYLRPFGQAPIVQTYTLPPTSRTTIQVDEVPLLENSDVSATITSSRPIIVERAMYRSFPDQPFGAGHGSAGVTAPATNWFFAEGATGPFFDLFILLANPGGTGANVHVDYLLTDGSAQSNDYTVPANGRFTIWVDDDQIPAGSGIRPLANATPSAIVTSTQPIVAERTMWWAGAGFTDRIWGEGHNSFGALQTGLRWALAEGEVGGPQGAETYVLVANTSPQPGAVHVQLFFEDGTLAERDVNLPPTSRTTLGISATFPEAAGRRFGALIESTGASPVQIVVERAMYTSPGGVTWGAGTNALATRLP